MQRPSSQWAGQNAVVVTTRTRTTTTTETKYTNTTEYIGGLVKNYLCGLYEGQDNRAGLPLSFPIAYYAVLANNTLYPINVSSMILASVATIRGSTTMSTKTTLPTSYHVIVVDLGGYAQIYSYA